MVWILLLCHFTADYPLQTDAIVKAKKHFLGLTGHVMIHFMTMLIIMVGVLHMQLALVLPGILTLTSLHFAIDTWKNILSKKRPDWVIFTYLQDQLLHIISILLVTFLIMSNVEIVSASQQTFWVIPILSVLLATHVWFVTERILAHRSQSYQRWVNRQFCQRMISRAILLFAWFLGWNLWAVLVFCFGLSFHWLDLRGRFHVSAILIDLSVVFCIVTGLSII